MTVALSALLSYFAYTRHFLTAAGSLAALFVALDIGLLGSLSWLLLIIVFVASAFITTRFRLLDKSRIGVQEGRRGERGAINVLANSLPAVIIAAIHYVFPQHSPLLSFLYLVSIGAATADTVASEIGVLDGNARLITNFRPVPRGTDGGVSLLGTVASGASALFIVSAGYGLMSIFGQAPPFFMLPYAALFGFLGSIVDSILGAALERRAIIGKHLNNISSIVIACLLALLLVP